jgi:hypothetical protein
MPADLQTQTLGVKKGARTADAAFSAAEASQIAAALENEAALLPDGLLRSALMRKAASYRKAANRLLSSAKRSA